MSRPEDRSARLGEGEESLGRRLLLSPLVPASWIWALGARLDRASYTSGLRPTDRVPCKVVAIGSPIAGGTAKTPLSAFVAEALAARGHRVVVASRGYGRRRRAGRERDVRVVSDGERLWGTAADCGDEPMWIAARCPGVPVLVAANRARAGRMACSVFGADVLVLDDGLQHHRLEHDVAIATLDGARGLAGGHILPRGPLREPPSMLRRCDALVTIGEPASSGALGTGERDARLVQKFAAGLLQVAARREIAGVRGLGRRDLLPPESLDGLEVGLLAGIARPQSLRASIEARGARVVAQRLFRDHHRYRAGDLQRLGEAAPIWLTSEKDAVKLNGAWLRDVDMRVVVSELRVEDGAAFVDWIEQRAALRRPA